METDQFERLSARLEKLRAEPFPSDVKRVVGRKEKLFRIRVGKHRILYTVFHEASELLVLVIDKRDSVYQ
ncbi:type II toxin-antitoxin system RelE/ParE family toxin [Candidatus Woesearchaeota archaeon]|nr:type II toxin-antitoxin system RelE/ParE family toxin [Candidatus Woesearchaeota archaeon]